MQAKNADLPKDLMALLQDNLKSGRPLLDDAVLYRGTRVPDQTSSSYSADAMHGSLLPQVAASYTHNWKEETSFIGAYKVDRESTRFYQDFGLEQKLDGKQVPSMSVKEAEQMLEPFVRDLVNARDGRERGRAEEKLESAIKGNLYEANVPTRTAAGEPNRPADLYVYGGRPDIAIRQAVGMQMTKVGPKNEAQVKAVMFKHHRNPAIRSIHQLSAQVGDAQPALNVLKSIAQRDFSEKLVAEHGHKPLNRMMDDVAKQAMSPEQERVGRFAKALMEGVSHPNPAVKDKAMAIVGELAKLDGNRSTFQDVAKVSSGAAAKVAGADAGAGAPKVAEASKDGAAPAPRAPAMDR